MKLSAGEAIGRSDRAEVYGDFRTERAGRPLAVLEAAGAAGLMR
jgi:hypothetical protein